MTNIIDELEREEVAKSGRSLDAFNPGDTVLVNVWVVEGNRERTQPFEGTVIAKSSRGINSSFTVRKVSHGQGVERVFQLHSPQIESINVKRRGDVRQAKLYYLRERSGKAARIKEKVETKASKKASKESGKESSSAS